MLLEQPGALDFLLMNTKNVHVIWKGWDGK